MNRGVVCGIIFAVIVIGAVLSLMLIDHSTEHFLELIDSVTSAYESGDIDRTEEEISVLEKHWEKHYKRLSFLVPSGVLGDISHDIARLRYLCRSRTDDFIAECRGIRYRITLVRESQLPKLLAVF